MTSELLRISGLVHQYRDRAVLTGLDLAVRRGEVFGLLGPNGSGKSTAFAVLAGLLPCQGGTIAFDGTAMATADRRLRAQMGVVFQSPSLDAKLTCRQNLELAATLRRVRHASERVDEQLAAAGLADRASDLVGQLSGGMRRRLDIARALLHGPRLLLMDEPTAGLDESSFRTTWQRLLAMRAGSDLTVLLTTHRPEEAELCDRIAVLSDGKALVTDTPQALRERVSSDVVVLKGEAPETLATEAAARFGLPTLLDGDEVVIECDRGHELIPRIVEAFGSGRLTSVSLRRPGLGDVFLKITGHTLERLAT